MLLGPLQMHQPGLFGHPGLEAESEGHHLASASSSYPYRCIKQEDSDLRTCDSSHSSSSADSASLSIFNKTRVPYSAYDSTRLTSVPNHSTAMYSMKVPDGPSPAFRLTASSLSQKAALVWPGTADASSVHAKSASVTSLATTGHPLGATLGNPNGGVSGRPVSPSPGLAHWMSMIDHSHGHMPAPAHTGPAHHHASEQLHYSMWNGGLDVSEEWPRVKKPSDQNAIFLHSSQGKVTGGESHLNSLTKGKRDRGSWQKGPKLFILIVRALCKRAQEIKFILKFDS